MARTLTVREEGADLAGQCAGGLISTIGYDGSPYSPVGESWRDRIRRRPEVRVEIEEKIYTMTATVIDNEELRRRMLKDRGYIYPWAGITIFRFEAISESEIRRIF